MVIWAALEAHYQYRMRKVVSIKAEENRLISLPDFKKRLLVGQQLVILDDVVLDVK